jgi:hypothetical protein
MVDIKTAVFLGGMPFSLVDTNVLEELAASILSVTFQEFVILIMTLDRWQLWNNLEVLVHKEVSSEIYC